MVLKKTIAWMGDGRREGRLEGGGGGGAWEERGWTHSECWTAGCHSTWAFATQRGLHNTGPYQAAETAWRYLLTRGPTKRYYLNRYRDPACFATRAGGAKGGG